MNEIWANRLIAGTKNWNNVPDSRKGAVLVVLAGRVENGSISADKYHEITGQEYEA